MAVLALISDLMMQSQVSSAAERAGVELSVVSSEAALAEQTAGSDVKLVIVDLSHPKLDPADVMARLRPVLPPDAVTLAFGPHVHKARLDAASRVGFTHVLSRGQFHANMESLLQATGE